jgi:hypothetical protein
MTRSEKIRKNREDNLIGRLYLLNCNGMAVSVLDIPKIYEMAREMLRKGDSHERIGQAMVEFVREHP